MQHQSFNISESSRISAQNEVRYLIECSRLVSSQAEIEEVESLQQALTTYSGRKKYSEKNTLLTTLEQDEHPVILRLTSRFGPYRLSQNIFAMTLRTRIIDLSKQLSQFIQLNLDLGQIGISKQIFFYESESDAMVEVPFATMVYQLCQETQNLTDHLCSSLTPLFEFLPSLLASSIQSSSQLQEEEKKLALALGFKELSTKNLHIEHLCIAINLCPLLSNYRSILKKIFLGIKSKENYEDSNQIETLLSELGIHLNQLYSLKTVDDESNPHRSISNREYQRGVVLKNIDLAIATLSQLLQRTYSLTRSCYSKATTTSYNEPASQLEKKFSHGLMEKGVDPREALCAAGSLVQKMVRSHDDPSSFLISEWQQIHQKFDAKIMSTIETKQVPSENDRYSINQRREYTMNFEQMRVKLSSCTELLKQLTCLFICLVICGCGVKTTPLSSTIDPRPSLPQHHQQPEPTLKLQKNQLKLK